MATAKTKTHAAESHAGYTHRAVGSARRAQHLAAIDLGRFKAASFKDNGCFSTFGARVLCAACLTLCETERFVHRENGYFGNVRACMCGLRKRQFCFPDNLALRKTRNVFSLFPHSQC